MRGKDQSRLAVAPQPSEPGIDFFGVKDVALAPRVGIEHSKPVDMGEFGRNASEIVPNAA